MADEDSKRRAWFDWYNRPVDRPSIIATLLLVGLGFTFPTCAQTTPTAGPAPVVKAQEPPVLKIIMDAHWKLDAARPQLPPVQIVHEEKLETQD